MFSHFSKFWMAYIVCGTLLIFMESLPLYWSLKIDESAYLLAANIFEFSDSNYGFGLASGLLVSFYFFSQPKNGHFSNNLLFLNNNVAKCDFLG